LHGKKLIIPYLPFTMPFLVFKKQFNKLLEEDLSANCQAGIKRILIYDSLGIIICLF